MATVQALLRFHGELRDFLAPSRRAGAFVCSPGATDTVKHVAESFGVPHTEIQRITINGVEAPFTSPIPDGAEVDVHPWPQPVRLEDPRFVLDGHLGRLAAYLRMLGFDTWYDRYADDVLLANVCSRERRVLLTRDVGLLKRREVEAGRFIRSDRPHEQLREIASRFDLLRQRMPFTRCMDCNGLLRGVSKEEVFDVLPPHTRLTKTEFSRCTQCGKVYWRGSHHARMLAWIEDLTTPSGFSEVRIFE